MQRFKPILDWIAAQQPRMLQTVIDWSNTNTGTGNVAGILRQAELIERFAVDLGGEISRSEIPPAQRIDSRGNPIPMPLGPAISIVKRPRLPRRVFLGIHMDTVYSPDNPFQTTDFTPEGNLRGPGVADAKGGLVVMLTALAAFERSEWADRIGWEVLINPDEEIGSPGSRGLFDVAAKRNRVGLLFEPALPDGSLVDRRKGSSNFSIIIRGKSAHAGRDFAQGRSALLAAAKLALALNDLNNSPGVTLNIGSIDGGGPPNVVPDLAICRVNARTTDPGDLAIVERAIHSQISALNSADGISAQLHSDSAAPPKIPDSRGRELLDLAISCGRDLGMNLSAAPSGGTCDGNRLAAAGLPNIDSLGVCGGNLHSPQEFLRPDSLTQRTQLAATILMKLAVDEK